MTFPAQMLLPVSFSNLSRPGPRHGKRDLPESRSHAVFIGDESCEESFV